MKIPQLILPLLLVLLFASCGSAPKTGSTGDIETAMVKALQWQEANPIFASDPTDWTNGAYYTGVARAYESTKNPTFLQAIEDMGNRTDWKTWERFFHADDVAISYSYLTMNAQKPGVVDLKPTASWIEDHLYKNHEWKEGTRDDDKVILWWWCDALFMAPPVLVRWSNLKNDRRYLQQMHKYTHERRMEVYLYFDVPGEEMVMHFMGQPTETRHIAVRNLEAVISPPWSIHSGAGTSAYRFVWGMAGENQAFTDMDAAPLPSVR